MPLDEVMSREERDLAHLYAELDDLQRASANGENPDQRRVESLHDQIEYLELEVAKDGEWF